MENSVTILKTRAPIAMPMATNYKIVAYLITFYIDKFYKCRLM